MLRVEENSMPESVAASPEVLIGDSVLLAQKVQTALGMMVDQHGVSNIAHAGDLLYDAVYFSEGVLDHRQIPESVAFPNRNSILATPLKTLRTTHRTVQRKEFIDAFRDAITRNVDHKDCLYPGAFEFVEAAAKNGPVAFWTQGDMYGQPAGEMFGVSYDVQPGSYEQAKKIAGGGFDAIRLAIARAAFDEDPTLNLALKIKQSMTMIALEDKFSALAMNRLVEYFGANEISEVTLYEDRLDNIQRLQMALGARGIKVYGIWVRQGRHAFKDQPVGENTVAVGSIREAGDLLLAQSQDGIRRGSITDFDGVLSDQQKRVGLQQRAVELLFKERNWAF